MLEAGQQVGNYRVVGLIGQGGMGLVYKAQHQHLSRQAAIKIMRPEVRSDGQSVTRFLNEARAMTLVKHPGLLEIFEFGLLPDGSPHIIMELLRGETLAARLRQAGGRLAQAAKLGRGIALALAAAHEAGVVHRDLKPHNVILITDSEQAGAESVKVIDFGVAKLDAAVCPFDLVEPAPRTRGGAVLGTPEYMAPEQCLGAAQADARADVYALGVMLYEVLAGRRPFVAELPSEIMTLQVRCAPPPLRGLVPNLPEALGALVHGMLSKRLDDRPTMSQVAERLLPWSQTPLVWAPQASPDPLPDAPATQSCVPAEQALKPKLHPASPPSPPPRRALARVLAAKLMPLIGAVALTFSVVMLRQRSTAPSVMWPQAGTAALVPAARSGPPAAVAAPVATAAPVEATPERKAPTALLPKAAPPAAKSKGEGTSSVRLRSNTLVIPLFKPSRENGD